MDQGGVLGDVLSKMIHICTGLMHEQLVSSLSASMCPGECLIASEIARIHKGIPTCYLNFAFEGR